MKIVSLIVVLFSQFVLLSQTWESIGPEGGYFKEFTFHPISSNIVYAGSDDGGGVWKSEDNGGTWNLLTAEFPNMTGWKIEIDENSPNIIYACDMYGRYGVLKSTDGGNSWELKNTGLNTVYDKMVTGIAIKTTDTLFISTGDSDSSTPVRPGNGVFKSYDAGNTWSEAGLQGKTVPCIGKNEFGTIFAGTQGDGLYYSNDNGMTWIIHPGFLATGHFHEIQTIDNLILVASSEGVFLSEDWGINFTNIGLAGEFNFDACIHKTTPEVEVYSSTFTGLKHYTAATATWTNVIDPFFDDQLVIGISSNGTTVYCGGFSDSPITKSADGGLTWNETVTSPKSTEINALFIDPNNNMKLLAGLMGTYNLNGDYDRESIYESINGGLTWTRKGPDAHALCITANSLHSETFYLGSFGQGLYKTTTNFDSYTQLSLDGLSVNDVIVSTQDTSTVIISEFDFVAPTTKILRSINGGSSFTTVSNLTANKLLFNPNNNDTVYVATNNGLHLSNDNGLSFSPWVLTGVDCRTLAFSNNAIYTATTDGKVFKVLNETPIDISGNWNTPVEIKSILIENDQLFVGLNGAEKDTFMVLHGSIWQSNNDGQTWTDMTSNMTSTNIYGTNTIVSNGHELFVGTYGGGVYKSEGLNLSASIQENNSLKPITIFPNPSSDFISVEFEVAQGVEFMICNVLGENVSNMVKVIASFENQIKLDISNLPKGIYMITVEEDAVQGSQFIKN